MATVGEVWEKAACDCVQQFVASLFLGKQTAALNIERLPAQQAKLELREAGTLSLASNSWMRKAKGFA
jgi:hypothetical protein